MAKKSVILLVALALAFSFQVEKSSAADNLIIATATTGGTYYPVGVAIGTLISIKLAKSDQITATAINSAGSGENVQMLKNKEAEHGHPPGAFRLERLQRQRGRTRARPSRTLCSVTMLWENVEHFVILKPTWPRPAPSMDLQNFGKKFSIGKRGSGTEGSGRRTILASLGIDPEKEMTLEYLAYTPSAQAMMDGRIAGMPTLPGRPARGCGDTQLYAQHGRR